jgi:dTMP kinase
MKINKRGIFITFEGIDGAGKTIQSKLLFDYLTSQNFKVILTREPGGTHGAEQIRNLVLTGEIDRWHPITESLLYLSSRSDHWLRVIKPALDNGQIVICDRFQDSSIVYQGMCKGVDLSFLNYIYNSFTNNIYPDKTFLIDMPPEISIKRSISRCNNIETRFENMDLEFHKKSRESFLKLSTENKRFTIINGTELIDNIHQLIVQETLELIKNNRVG